MQTKSAVQQPAVSHPGTGAPPHPDAVLTPDQCAYWLGLKRRQLQRAGVPHVRVSHKIRRYRVRDVLAWLEQRAVPTEVPTRQLGSCVR